MKIMCVLCIVADTQGDEGRKSRMDGEGERETMDSCINGNNKTSTMCTIDERFSKE